MAKPSGQALLTTTTTTASSPGGRPPAVAGQTERFFEEAQDTGRLILSGQQLKAYPSKLSANYDLSDTVAADLSKNRLAEIDPSICQFFCLQSLDLYNNLIRSIPQQLNNLQFLNVLNLSRNQLSVISPTVCQLSRLKILVISHNKLVAIPEEISQLTYLQELDLSCNEIDRVPEELCHLEDLRSLDLRSNKLQELPECLGDLKLTKLDVSINRIQRLPLGLRFLKTLEKLDVSHNPLTLPPAHACRRGLHYVFKHLHVASQRLDTSASGRRLKGTLTPSEPRTSFSAQSRDRDSGYGTTNESLHADLTGYVGFWNAWSEEDGKENRLEEFRARRSRRSLKNTSTAVGTPPKSASPKRVSSPGAKVACRPPVRPTPPPPPPPPTRNSSIGNDSIFEFNSSFDDDSLQKAPREALSSLSSIESQAINSSGTLTPHSTLSGRASPCPSSPREWIDAASSEMETPENQCSLKIKIEEELSPPKELRSQMDLLQEFNEITSDFRIESYRISPNAKASLSNPSRQHVDQNRNSPRNDCQETMEFTKEKPYHPIGQEITATSPFIAGEKANKDRNEDHLDNREFLLDENRALTVEVDQENNVDEDQDPYVPKSDTSSSSLSPTSPMPPLPPLPTTALSSIGERNQFRSAEASVTKQPPKPSSVSRQPASTRLLSSTMSIEYDDADDENVSVGGEEMWRDDGFSPISTSGSTPPSPAAPILGREEEAKDSAERTTSTPTISSQTRVTYVGKFPASPLDSPIVTPRPAVSTPMGVAPPRLVSPASRDASPIADEARARRRLSSSLPSPVFGGAEDEGLRATIERKLKIRLPDGESTSEILSDGVILCNLVNQLKPRSVPSIHVPSPQFPKLSIHKSRLNVENFLSACRRLGVEERRLCAADDVVEELRPSRVADAISAIIEAAATASQCATGSRPDTPQTPLPRNDDDLFGSVIGEPEMTLDEKMSRWKLAPGDDAAAAAAASTFQDRVVSYLCLLIFFASVVTLLLYNRRAAVA